MINDFKKIRRDGNVITESLTLEEIALLGWSPDKVIAVTWENDTSTVELKAPHGVLAKTLSDREGVVWLEDTDETGLRSTLLILIADGSVRLVMPNSQHIEGRSETGIYCWYEPARSSMLSRFGAVFRADRDQSLFQIDIDLNTGTTEGVYPLR